MFNRHFQVKVVKDDKKKPTEEETIAAFKTITEVISVRAANAGKKILGGVLIYVAADTCRKVLIAKASK